MLRALMRIRFCSLAINDFSKNTLPLFFPDVDVHTASTSSPSSKQRGDRTGSHSPANQGSLIVNPCSQAPGSPQFPQSSRAGGLLANQPADLDTVELLDCLTRAALGATRLGSLTSKPPAMKRSPQAGGRPSRTRSKPPYQAQKWRRARFPSGLKKRRGIQLPDRQSLGFSWA